MAKLTPTDWKTQLKIFEAYGCRYKRKKGSHRYLKHMAVDISAKRDLTTF
ncbi:MAG: type II toxin-antitoxin system HicA family toxin [Deltaproteobacteria bacterium]|nr:type II toxin-antitoxin system HicA family toxin [Deltaproteobacteria bacterium]